MEERQIVRATLMRATLHLVTGEDYRLLRPALQPALNRSLRSIAGKRLEGLDLDRIVRRRGRAWRSVAHLRGAASPAL